MDAKVSMNSCGEASNRPPDIEPTATSPPTHEATWPPIFEQAGDITLASLSGLLQYPSIPVRAEQPSSATALPEEIRTDDACAANPSTSSDQGHFYSVRLQYSQANHGGAGELAARQADSYASPNCNPATVSVARQTNTHRPSVSIKKILNLNETVEPSESNDAHSNATSAPSAPISKDGNPIWKLLVFDVSSTRGFPPVTTDVARSCADWAPDRTLVAM